jgi:hypothetical protein
MKFRQKSIVVDAVRVIRGNNKTPLPETVEYDRRLGWRVWCKLHGWIPFAQGDWIVTGPTGATFPCADEVFRSAYEPAD